MPGFTNYPELFNEMRESLMFMGTEKEINNQWMDPIIANTF